MFITLFLIFLRCDFRDIKLYLMKLNKENNRHELKPFSGYGRVNSDWNGVVFPVLDMIDVLGW